MRSSSACAAPPYTPWNVERDGVDEAADPRDRFAGSTSRMQKIGTTYMRTPVMPLRRIEIGTSRCGSSISSAAPFCNSKPT